MANLPSILRNGILSHTMAQRYSPVSVADPEIQGRRATRKIPGGLRLHQYVNLYFNARNAMLYRIAPRSEEPPTDLTILRVHHSVLNLPDVVITDINAAADIGPRWHTVEEVWGFLDEEEIFAEFWTGSGIDPKRKQRMMAEVLVPYRVPPEYVTGSYVVSKEMMASLPDVLRLKAVEVNPYMFFRVPRT